MSTIISRVSAAVLLVGGLCLLFAPDVALSRLTPGFPAAALWLGQMLGAAWLGMAALNWLNRFGVIGGIYGRPVVMANSALYFISTMVILRAAQRTGFTLLVWIMLVPAAALAVVYGVLLFRGPLSRDLDAGASARKE